MQAGADELVARVRALLAGGEADGQRLGRRAVAAQLGVTEYQARVALDLVGATTGPAPAGTGTTAKPGGLAGGGAR